MMVATATAVSLMALVSASAATQPTALSDGLVQKLVGSQGGPGENLGKFSVATDGSTLVVGTHLGDIPGTNDAGVVYVYTRSGDQWIETQVLTAPDASSQGYFGTGLAVDGDTMVIGGYGKTNSVPQSNAGSAYVFTRSGQTWSYAASLVPTDTLNGSDFYGWSVDLDGDTAVVSAHGRDDKGNFSGAAYVFTGSGSAWTPQAKLLASDGAANDLFGKNVAVSGDRIVVGAYLDVHTVKSGSAYIFKRVAGVWAQEFKLVPADGVANDYFGDSVDIDGTTVVVGARWDDDRGSASGSAYVWTLTAEPTWTLQAKLVPADGLGSDEFGTSVAVSGDFVAVGAPGDDTAGLPGNHGSAYLFRRTAGSWDPVRKAWAPDAVASLTFGLGAASAVLPDGTMACTNPLDDNGNGQDAGAAYVFQNPLGYGVEDSALEVTATAGVLLNDTDPDGDPLTAELLDDAVNGSVSLNVDGTFTYTPDPDFSGIDYFTYRANDGVYLSQPATAYVSIAPVNDAPSFVAGGNVTVDEDTPYTASWATSVSAGPGEAESVSFGVTASDTALFDVQPTITDTGTLSFVPAANAFGSTEVTVTLTDTGSPALASTPVVFTITVQPVNDAPVALPATMTVTEDGAVWVTDPSLLDGAIDPEGDPITAELAGPAANGTVTVEPDGSYIYTPDPDFFGTDEFAFRATDGSTASAPATVTVTVTPVNDPPSFSAGTSVTVDQNVGAYSQTWATNVLAGPGGETETVTFEVTNDMVAVFSEQPTIAPDGRLSFTPATHDNGQPITVSVILRDEFGLASESTTFTLRVLRVNTPATAFPDAYAVTEDGALSVPATAGVLLNDNDAPENDQMYSEMVTGPASGEATLAADGSFTYLPDADFFGSDTFTYRVTDPWGGVSQPATVTIAVDPVNDAPSFSAGGDVSHDRYTGAYSGQWATGISAGPLESEAVSFSVSVADPSMFATMPAIASDGTLSFEFEPDAFGSTVASVTLYDATGASAGPVEFTLTAVVADLSHPVTTALVSPVTWTSGDVTVTLSRVDQGDPDSSGLAATYYRIDGGGTNLYGAPIVIEEAGDHLLEFWSVDRNGNEEPHNFEAARIDRVAPDTAPENLKTTYVADTMATVDLSVTDDLSGDEFTEWAVRQSGSSSFLAESDGKTVTFVPRASVPTSYTLEFASTDLAGNRETTKSVGFTVVPSDVPGTVTRVQGSDRYATAVTMARKGWDPSGNRSWPNVDYVIIANGETGKEADPLSAAGLAGAYDAPVLLARAAALPKPTKDVITEIAARRKAQGKKLSVILVGGTAVLPDARWNEIRRIPGVSATKDRVAGGDRYQTSAQIAKRMIAVNKTAPGAILIAADNPNAFYDALAASPIAFATGRPMLSVKKGGIPPSVASVLNSAPLKGKVHYAASSAAYMGSAASAGAKRMTASSNRYTAAVDISKYAVREGWLAVTDTGIAAKLPDSLGGGAFLGKRGGVLLFTDSSRAIQPTTKAYITANAKKVDFGWVLGGPVSVPAGQESGFRAITK